MKYFIVRCVLFLLLLLVLSGCIVKKSTYLESQNALAQCNARESALLKEYEDLQRLNSNNLKTIDSLDIFTEEQKSMIKELSDEIMQYKEILSDEISQKEKLDFMLEAKIKELASRENKIKELQDIISAQEDMVNNLLSKVKNALIGFNSDELSVEVKNGKIYVVLANSLLFKPGRADIDEKGNSALAKLAEILRSQPDITIQIIGHTDTDPISNERFKDNWDLSVIRATSVVRILVEENGIDPSQVVPSGHGEFFPVGDNETVEGKAKNRRTEIIISPKLDALFELLNR